MDMILEGHFFSENGNFTKSSGEDTPEIPASSNFFP